MSGSMLGTKNRSGNETSFPPFSHSLAGNREIYSTFVYNSRRVAVYRSEGGSACSWRVELEDNWEIPVWSGSVERCTWTPSPALHPFEYTIKVASGRRLRVNYANFPGMGCMTFFCHVSYKQWVLERIPGSIIMQACSVTLPLLEKSTPCWHKLRHKENN